MDSWIKPVNTVYADATVLIADTENKPENHLQKVGEKEENE